MVLTIEIYFLVFYAQLLKIYGFEVLPINKMIRMNNFRKVLANHNHYVL